MYTKVQKPFKISISDTERSLDQNTVESIHQQITQQVLIRTRNFIWFAIWNEMYFLPFSSILTIKSSLKKLNIETQILFLLQLFQCSDCLLLVFLTQKISKKKCFYRIYWSHWDCIKKFIEMCVLVGNK